MVGSLISLGAKKTYSCTVVRGLCEKWTDQHDMSVAQRNKSESPTGMEPVTSQTSGGMGYVAFSVSTYMYMHMILLFYDFNRRETHTTTNSPCFSSILKSKTCHLIQ